MPPRSATGSAVASAVARPTTRPPRPRPAWSTGAVARAARGPRGGAGAGPRGPGGLGPRARARRPPVLDGEVLDPDREGPAPAPALARPRVRELPALGRRHAAEPQAAHADARQAEL